MMKKYFTILNIILVSLVFFLATLLNHNAANATTDGFTINNFETTSGLQKTGIPSGFNTMMPSTTPTIEGIIAKVIAIALSLIGIFFLVLMLYSGYLWLMSKGDTKDIEKAKENIKTALIGLIVVLSAYAVTRILVPLLTTWVG